MKNKEEKCLFDDKYICNRRICDPDLCLRHPQSNEHLLEREQKREEFEKEYKEFFKGKMN